MMSAEHPTEQLSPILQEQAAYDAYMTRYDHVPAAIVAERKGSYPHFPAYAEVLERVTDTTKISLAETVPEDTDEGIRLIEPLGFTFRQSFKGAPEDAYAAYAEAGGVNVTDPRLHLPESTQVLLSEKCRQAVVKKTAEDVYLGQCWWGELETAEFPYTGIGEDINEGRLSETFEVRHGEQALQIVNLDRPITDDEIEEMRQVIERVSEISEGRVFERVKIIVLQYADRFYGQDGRFLPGRGILCLNTVARDLQHLIKERQFVAGDWSHFQNVIAHELGHTLDIGENDKRAQDQHNELDKGDNEGSFFASAFTVPLGWRYVPHHFADYPRYHAIQGIQEPSKEVWIVDEDGSEQKVVTRKHFDDADLASDLPVTSYAYSSPSEDYAEAFRRYALAGPESLGALRRSVVEHTIAKLVGKTHTNYDASLRTTITRKKLNDIQTGYSVPTEKKYQLLVNEF